MKKKVLSILVFAGSVFVLLSTGIACKKISSDGGHPDYYMRFKANGTQISYITAQAAFSAAGGLYICTLNGLDAHSNMNIILTDKSPIEANVNYTEAIVPSLGNSYVLIGYQDNSGISYLSGNPVADPDAAAKTTLTAITDDYVKGTFSGKVTKGSTIITITEGEFILKRVTPP